MNSWNKLVVLSGLCVYTRYLLLCHVGIGYITIVIMLVYGISPLSLYYKFLFVTVRGEDDIISKLE